MSCTPGASLPFRLGTAAVGAERERSLLGWDDEPFDLAVLRDQAVFGPVASTPTALADVDETALASPASARAQAREAPGSRPPSTVRACPRSPGRGARAARAGSGPRRHAGHLPLREDQATRTCRGGFGFHPLLSFLANTGEALSGRLRPGNAGANTVTDHIPCWTRAGLCVMAPRSPS